MQKLNGISGWSIITEYSIFFKADLCHYCQRCGWKTSLFRLIEMQSDILVQIYTLHAQGDTTVLSYIINWRQSILVFIWGESNQLGTNPQVRSSANSIYFLKIWIITLTKKLHLSFFKRTSGYKKFKSELLNIKYHCNKYKLCNIKLIDYCLIAKFATK